ncbi:transposable element Tcb2 transposase [Trichonephila clavipes]|nr:transposable element Tcb2 transposase [Trichonephila clavipes]
MIEDEVSARRVARQLGHSDCVLRRCWDQWTQEMSFPRRLGSAHPRQTNRRKDYHIVATSLVATVSSRTIRRRLAEGHLGFAPITCRRPLLHFTPIHRRLRLELYQARGNCTAAEWNQVVFSDESRFNIGSDNNHVRVWRPRGEYLNPAFVLQQHTASTASVMV